MPPLSSFGQRKEEGKREEAAARVEGGEALGRLSPPNKFASRAEEDQEEIEGRKRDCFPGSTNRATNRRQRDRQTGGESVPYQTLAHANSVVPKHPSCEEKYAKLNPSKDLHRIV